jgi:hypothetical protein
LVHNLIEKLGKVFTETRIRRLSWHWTLPNIVQYPCTFIEVGSLSKFGIFISKRKISFLFGCMII